MSRHRPLRLAGIALILVAPVVGCIVSGSNGDPGPTFEGGHHPPPNNYGGAPGSGSAGASGGAGRSAADGGAGTRDAAVGDGAASDGSVASPCSATATATFALAWTVEDGTGAASTCDAQGGATVDVTIVNPATGATTTQTVPCATMAATTCSMPGGAYEVTLNLRNLSGTVLAAIVAPTLFLVDRTSTEVASLPFTVGGADATSGRGFALTWSIEQSETSGAETCAQAGAATVRLIAGTKTFDLPCGDGKGRTAVIAPGDYPVTLHLIDAQGADLSVTQTMSLHVDEGQLIFLGNVVFDVI